MHADEELMEQLMASFREELAERLAAINADLLALEQQPKGEEREQTIQELFRHVHSLKGAARAVALHPIEELAHGIEEAFGATRRGEAELTAELFDLFYRGFDLISAAMANVSAGEKVDKDLDIAEYLGKLGASWQKSPPPPQPDLPATEQAPSIWVQEQGVRAQEADSIPPYEAPPQEHPVAPGAAPSSWSGDTIRVATARLDGLMAQTGELLVSQMQIAQQAREIEQQYATIAGWQREWQQVRNNIFRALQWSADGASSQLREFLEQNEDQLRNLMTWFEEYTERTADNLARLALVVDELQEGVKQARMLPLASLIGTFRRMVRDLAREQGKEVALETYGADTEMDKHVLEQVKDPLMHLLRNCIDHGIEQPAARERAGKPRQGTINLSAERHGNLILIQVADDGAGIDAQVVREAAVRRGILQADEAAEMSDDAIMSLIFLPGLTTLRVITEVSGRGIGLDVVRKNVESLQGSIEIKSEVGKGSAFILTLPLTLVSTHCLLMRVAGQTFAVPLAAVGQLVPVTQDAIVSVEGGQAIHYEGEPLSLVHLTDVLNLPPREPLFASEEEELPAAILEAGGQRIAFLVEKLVGHQELVVKSLGKQLARVPNIAGAAVLGTGEVVHVLNVADLVKSARSKASQRLPARERKEETERRKVILVIDDSITTRTLEKNILTTAGYEVRLATNGEEALAVLAENPCDLIVSDIDMPRIDGFEFTRMVKGDERYQDIPLILVTSLGNDEDKAKGIAAGADAYIAKSTFDQDDLLETIEQLV
ncbi:MAG: hybrid sensor histidine kinase/response regulator [Anaerolineae bacterium]|nr:hybrid sensor histidine kinase/response regulator [Anaerolineae bacterium]